MLLENKPISIPINNNNNNNSECVRGKFVHTNSDHYISSAVITTKC